MNIVTVDFETYWDQSHSLEKMSSIEYVMHPKTQIISMAIKEGDGPVDVVFGEDAARQRLSAVDLDNAMLIGHNMAGFDSMILAWRFGVRPRMWGCTASMARPFHSKTTGNSLKALVAHYGIGVKDATVLHNTKGKRLEDFTQEELNAMAKYNAADVDQCYALFKVLLPRFSAKELWHIDATVRMLVDSKFEVDRALLETALSEERKRKRKAVLLVAKYLKELGIASDAMQACETLDELEEAVRTELASSAKFAKLLEALGVEVPMKPSPTNPDRQTPALAKSDEEFLALLDHPNEIVAAATRARLAVKSTLLETRIESFLAVEKATGGKLPVPLKYCGADTTGRWSGELYNMQNLPRITPDKLKTSDALRKSIRAPKGHKIVVADLSGIELRVNHFLWQVESSMELYAQDPEADLYKAFAAARYGISPDQVTKEQRFLAKIAQLGLGYGAGWQTFQRIAKLQGGLDLSDDEAQSVVQDWRTQYRKIVEGWWACAQALINISNGVVAEIDPWGLLTTERDGIRLPSGRLIYYPHLRKEPSPDGKIQWVYAEGRHQTKIYGGKVDENCVQALARDIIADHAVEFFKSTGLRPNLMVHDELVYVVPESDAEDALDELQKIMRAPPSWWPDLITWSEGSTAYTYGDAK